MSKTDEKPPRFELCGGHPALDFVNSLDKRFLESGPVELLVDYADLLRFTEQTRLLDTRQVRRLANSVNPGAAARTLRSARELREAMAAAFYGSLDGQPPLAADIRTLERHFHSASAHRELRWAPPAQNANGRSGIGWDWGRFETSAELPVWILSQTGSQLMMSDAMDRIRACGAETCRWLFLDTSKNHTRRWCNMRVCGNRMKARRFQARREE
jgi:predicted RNA-binding Zn ribbon-like protein